MARSLHIQLPDDVERFIDAASSGDAAGYVQEVLRREMELAAIRQRLLEGIDRGLDDLEAGRFVTLDAPALRAELDQIKAEGRAGLARGA